MLSLTPAILAAVLASAAEPGERPEEWTRPPLIVAIPPGASDAHQAAAKDLAAACGSVVIEAEVNPVCCVWVAITDWNPNPGRPGYFIINQPGGSLVNASSEEQLQAAMKRFKTSLRGTGEQVRMPVGLLTNYPLAAASQSD